MNKKLTLSLVAIISVGVLAFLLVFTNQQGNATTTTSSDEVAVTRTVTTPTMDGGFRTTETTLSDEEIDTIIERFRNYEPQAFCALSAKERQMISELIIDREIYPDFEKYPLDHNPLTPEEEEACGLGDMGF